MEYISFNFLAHLHKKIKISLSQFEIDPYASGLLNK